MDKVLVKVYVPMLEGIYDVWIPSNKKIYEIIVLLVKAIYELTEGDYSPKNTPTLYDKITAQEFDINARYYNKKWNRNNININFGFERNLDFLI